MSKVNLLATVLSYDGKNSFKGSDGAAVLYPLAIIRTDGKMFRIPVAVDCDLSAVVDKEVPLVVELSAKNDLAPRLKIVDIAE